ncbi:hypothetical protein [Trichothermofontia sp.]
MPTANPYGRVGEAEVTTGATTSAGITVDGYANRLMDDLFGDLERALDGSLQLPNTPLSQAEVVSLKRLSLAELSLPPVVPPAQDWPLATPTSPVKPSRSPGSANPPRPQRRGRWRYRLLLAFGVISLVTAGVVGSRRPEIWQPGTWQFVRSWLPSASSPVSAPVVEPTPIVNPDAEFSRYLQRALAMIEAQPTNGMATPPVPTIPNSINLLPSLTPPLVPPSTLEANPPAPDRRYVPIYPTSQLPTAPVPTGVPLPAQIPAAPTVPQSVPLPVQPTALPTPVTAPTASPSAPVASSTKYTLVGVLELGDRSTALFESNGVARRINMGESIGTSGWSLVEVNNQEAIIRRNGEVRSIYVGQAF